MNGYVIGAFALLIVAPLAEHLYKQWRTRRDIRRSLGRIRERVDAFSNLE